MAISDAELLKYVRENEFISKKQADEVEILSDARKLSIYDALLEKNILTDEQLGQIIADYLQCGFVRLSKEDITQEALHIIPEHIAKKYHIISFYQDQKSIKIATTEIKNTELFLLLKKKTARAITPYYATEQDIDDALAAYSQKMQDQF